ncbi:DNA-3-methyladenine glycosylase [Lacrimispora saccharolytica]|uniref:Putative 3-methyladenine DNA glycosylase n=1 Tax=Lacrimispora saccharolytica (strain ATCC 35040 / DSM 2544 / NRCC 2533 / WM1) TaxID=610130 RepID=D9R5L1_LACSW|nr:DNA-3-methyladenine glycosylase [Lacrimispora saccharolytica]ADL05194.1 DNA-3-methyladenine glycosylase [[Clostridium] saccharolyticum WM1]QRV20627.1 DNA-3-methyladenine glycosylase [Lacrimispora saccharolytica]
MIKLDREFYNRDSILVAREILGKVLVHQQEERRISARIVEAEAYMGLEDKAAHSYGGKRTPRVEVMYGDPGFAYIFPIYGMHYCFNIVTRERSVPQAVLIRAVEPLEGIQWMAQNRYGRPYEELTKSQKKGFANGPGKLCRALALDRSFNGKDLCGDQLFLEEGNWDDFHIIAAKRVGIDYAEEARDYLWRFYIEGSL